MKYMPLSYTNTITYSNRNRRFLHNRYVLVTPFKVARASNNTISGNNITRNNGDGIGLWDHSSFNSVFGNNIIQSNECGIGLFWYCNYNTISKNSIKNNGEGIGLSESSNYNSIFGNDIAANNMHGIWLDGSSDNIIYHNNFINNTRQAHTYNSTNAWDDGYPSGGNYWSDHVCTGNPSDGSQPCVIDENNVDRYPFQDLNGWIHQYTVTIYSSPTGVVFTVAGLPCTTPWSGTYFENTSISLVMPETHDEYVWSHWLEDGDTNRTKTVTMYANITLTGVFFHIADLNHDRVVNMKDIAIAAIAFGSYPSHTRWNPIADINKDNKVDMRDMALIARNFGKTRP